MPVLLANNIICELGLSNDTQGSFEELVYNDEKNPITLKMNSEVFSPSTIYLRKSLYTLVETSLSGLRPKLFPISFVKKCLSRSSLVSCSSKD